MAFFKRTNLAFHADYHVQRNLLLQQKEEALLPETSVIPPMPRSVNGKDVDDPKALASQPRQCRYANSLDLRRTGTLGFFSYNNTS